MKAVALAQQDGWCEVCDQPIVAWEDAVVWADDGLVHADCEGPAE